MSDKIFIVGGGPSLVDFDLSTLATVDTMCVNKSIFDVTFPRYFVTMDYTFLRKIDKPIVPTTKIFIANLTPAYMQEKDGYIVDTRRNLVYDLSTFDMVVKSRQEYGMGDAFRDFRHGSNSGFCALQLALLLGYKEVYLLGIDLNQTDGITHYHGGYGEDATKFYTKAQKYLEAFKLGYAECKTAFPLSSVWCCSKSSRLLEFMPYKDVSEVLPC